MSAAAHRGDHDIAFYEADIGETRVLNVSTAFTETADEDGPLIPGRYLVQLMDSAPTNLKCWVHVGPFEAGETLGGVAAPGRRRIPLSRQAAVAVELNVQTGHNDRIGGITSAGSATLYVTRVSTSTRKFARAR